MYSEQLAVLLLVMATQVASQGVGTQPMAQIPRDGAEKIGLNMKQKPGLLKSGHERAKVKREREAMLLAEFR